MALVAVDGSTFLGTCLIHGIPITGTVAGNATTVNVHGSLICINDAEVTASCGHKDNIIATGAHNADGQKIALLGDSSKAIKLVGTINGVAPNTTVNCS